jgi:hypothetical protein
MAEATLVNFDIEIDGEVKSLKWLKQVGESKFFYGGVSTGVWVFILHNEEFKPLWQDGAHTIEEEIKVLELILEMRGLTPLLDPPLENTEDTSTLTHPVPSES